MTSPDALAPPASLNGLFRRLASEPAPSVLVGSSDRTLSVSTWTAQQIDTAATLLAHHYAHLGLPVRSKGDASSKMTVGLLSRSSHHYIIQELAFLRMGYCESLPMV